MENIVRRERATHPRSGTVNLSPPHMALIGTLVQASIQPAPPPPPAAFTQPTLVNTYIANEKRTVPPLIPHGESIAPTSECLMGHPKYNSMQDYSSTLFRDRRLYYDKVSLYKIHTLAALSTTGKNDVFISIRAAEKVGLPIRTVVRCDEEWPLPIEAHGAARSHTLFFMFIPKDNEHNIDEVQKFLRQGRGPSNKIILAVQFATTNRLFYRLNSVLYDRASLFYMEECVTGLRTQTNFEDDMRRIHSDTKLLTHLIETSQDASAVLNAPV